MIENESSWCRFIVVLERRKERLTHWKDNHERGCRNQRRKEVGIPRGKNTYIRAIRASQRYSFKQQSDESKRRTLRFFQDFVRENFRLFLFLFDHEFSCSIFGREKNERVHGGQKDLRSKNLDGDRDDIRGALREWNRVCTPCIRKVNISFRLFIGRRMLLVYWIFLIFKQIIICDL